MNTGGEAAEQIVRMSLEGFEVAAKITGAGAKNIAILLYSILKEEKKTKGKARLSSMLRSGKELKVFTVKNGDLKKQICDFLRGVVINGIDPNSEARSEVVKELLMPPGDQSAAENMFDEICRISLGKKAGSKAAAREKSRRTQADKN